MPPHNLFIKITVISLCLLLSSCQSAKRDKSVLIKKQPAVSVMSQRIGFNRLVNWKRVGDHLIPNDQHLATSTETITFRKKVNSQTMNALIKQVQVQVGTFCHQQDISFTKQTKHYTIYRIYAVFCNDHNDRLIIGKVFKGQHAVYGMNLTTIINQVPEDDVSSLQHTIWSSHLMNTQLMRVSRHD